MFFIKTNRDGKEVLQLLDIKRIPRSTYGWIVFNVKEALDYWVHPAGPEFVNKGQLVRVLGGGGLGRPGRLVSVESRLTFELEISKLPDHRLAKLTLWLIYISKNISQTFSLWQSASWGLSFLKKWQNLIDIFSFKVCTFCQAYIYYMTGKATWIKYKKVVLPRCHVHSI